MSSDYSAHFGDHLPLSCLSFNIYTELSRWIQSIPEDQQKNIEVEFKFGTILSRATGQRIEIPIISPALVSLTEEHHFESSISISNHCSVNKLMNRYYCKLFQAGSPAKHRHDRITDKFYRTNSGKIRASFQDAKCVSKISKNTLHHFHIHYPNAQYDVRLSINIEKPLNDYPLENALPIFTRFKDRVSYLIPEFGSIDLSKVDEIETSRTNYELEIEINPSTLGSNTLINVIGLIDWIQCSFKV